MLNKEMFPIDWREGKMRAFSELTAKEVSFKLEKEPETIPVRGNAICSGDEDFDQYWEEEISKQVKLGGEWAWVCVTVTAEFEGQIGVCVLEKCHYFSEEDFRQNGEYEEMKQEALANLNYKRSQVYKTLSKMVV